MSVPLASFIETCEILWPLSGAEEWDSPGLVCGDANKPVSRVLLTVDVTREIVEEAIDGGFDLILAHHPFLLKPVNSVATQTSKGAQLSLAIKADLAIYAAHTNADIVTAGVSDVLATSLGLKNTQPIIGESIGAGRIGELEKPMQLGDFARLVAKILPSTATGIRVAGSYETSISRVAVCGGAGDSYIGAAIAAGADVYLTADLRHHPTQEAREAVGSDGCALIDVSHWASEWLWLEIAAEQLQQAFKNVQFVVSQIRTDPWEFVVTQ